MSLKTKIALSVIMTLSFANVLNARSASVYNGVGVVRTNPGEYRNVDVSSLLNIKLKELSSREKEQIQMMKQAIADINSKLTVLINKHIQPMKKAMSTATDASKALKKTDGSFTKFYDIYDGYINARTMFEVALSNLEILPDSLSSSSNVNFNGSVESYPSIINQSAFNGVVANFRDALTQVESELVNKVALINYDDTAPVPFGFDELEQARANIYFSTGELEALREKSVLMLARMGKQQNAIEKAFNMKILNEMTSFVNRWGIERAGRLTEHNAPQFEEDYKDLEKYFYIRSSIRIIFKVPLGSYGIKHELKSFNLENIGSDVSNVIFSGTKSISTSEDLKDAQDKVVNKLAVLNLRLASQDMRTNKEAFELGSQLTQIFTGDAKFMERLLGGISVTKGEMSKIKANEAILQLILTDIKEELLMHKFGGDMKLKIAHKARYSNEKAVNAYAETKSYLGKLAATGRSRRKLDTDSVEGSMPLVVKSLDTMRAKIAESNVIEEKIMRMDALTDRAAVTEKIDLNY
ncbi:MAG: hypothetical protein HON90_04635 [Halobacteriovoraceae bacterium]|jgi:hypothetical protein|nr:hypothetical protein [Halobacteriovoraceae bacterium]